MKLFHSLYSANFNTASGKCCCNVMIFKFTIFISVIGFNTASGKCCCNYITRGYSPIDIRVSIPQAVSAVATLFISVKGEKVMFSFNTASGKCCCNYITGIDYWNWESFNTASGKCCCNYNFLPFKAFGKTFQYRKR